MFFCFLFVCLFLFVCFVLFLFCFVLFVWGFFCLFVCLFVFCKATAKKLNPQKCRKISLPTYSNTLNHQQRLKISTQLRRFDTLPATLQLYRVKILPRHQKAKLQTSGLATLSAMCQKSPLRQQPRPAILSHDCPTPSTRVATGSPRPSYLTSTTCKTPISASGNQRNNRSATDGYNAENSQWCSPMDIR